jgi:RNase P/RNase MRP subunit p30
MFDIVMPSCKNDEVLFKDMSKSLGWSDVFFLSKNKSSEFIIADLKNIHSFRKNKIVFCKGSRDAIEKKAHVLFGFEDEKREDFLHQRASGLNHVLCNIMKKNGSFIAFDFSSILEVDNFFRSKILGRMQQNILLCRKYNVSMLPCSFAKNPLQMRSFFDFRAFFLELGMHPQEFIDGRKKFMELLNAVLKKEFTF